MNEEFEPTRVKSNTDVLLSVSKNLAELAKNAEFISHEAATESLLKTIVFLMSDISASLACLSDLAFVVARDSL